MLSTNVKEKKKNAGSAVFKRDLDLFPVQIVCRTLMIAVIMLRLLLTSAIFLLLMKWISTDKNLTDELNTEVMDMEAQQKIDELNTEVMDMEAQQKIDELNTEVTDMEAQQKIASQLVGLSLWKLSKDIKKLCRDTACNLPPDCSKCQHCFPVVQSEDRESTVPDSVDHTSEPISADQVAQKPVDCSDIYQNGSHTDGAYEVYPEGGSPTTPVRVYCDMTTDGGGWTVIQRRGDYGNPDDYFFRGWKDYKTGFGDVSKEFWLGNDNIYMLTNQRSYQLRVDLMSWEGDTAYVTYDRFLIDDETGKYRLHVGSVVSGFAGDSLRVQNEMAFTTKDRHNDLGTWNCAERFKGAWWYEKCHYSNLNGLHLKGTDTSGQGMVWKHWRNSYRSLKASEMKIRPADFHGNGVL